MENNKSEEFFSEKQIELADIARALSHPVRIYILELLSKQTCCYTGDIAEELPVARSTLSQHFKELKRAGLILGTTRPPKIMYCLNKEKWEMVKKMYGSFFDL
ncbi:MAG: helix-turn-helix transcriptional regulator [Deltaproteobacteria bacterium]|nr:helix-turn-helix transcriptional regulator [Deltaproteobacteria bacterium]